MERLQTWWVTELYPSKDEDNFGIAGDCEVVKFTDAQAIILERINSMIDKYRRPLSARSSWRKTARRSDGAAGGGKIMLEADKLNENAALIDGQYHVARPITLPFTWRFRGAWEVLMGRAEAVVFYKQ